MLLILECLFCLFPDILKGMKKYTYSRTHKVLLNEMGGILDTTNANA